MKNFPKLVFIFGVIALVAVAAMGTVATISWIKISGLHQTMQVVVSAALLAASLFVILSKRYSPTDKHWAYATVGTLLGFRLPK